MNNIDQSYTLELIEKAKRVGLLDSNLTINCIICNAIFPKNYDKCPQCETNKVQLNYVGLFNNNS